MIESSGVTLCCSFGAVRLCISLPATHPYTLAGTDEFLRPLAARQDTNQARSTTDPR